MGARLPSAERPAEVRPSRSMRRHVVLRHILWWEDPGAAGELSAHPKLNIGIGRRSLAVKARRQPKLNIGMGRRSLAVKARRQPKLNI